MIDITCLQVPDTCKYSIYSYSLVVILSVNIENTGAYMKVRARRDKLYRVLNGGLLSLDFILEMEGRQ